MGTAALCGLERSTIPKNALDAAGACGILLCSVWVYELLNLLVLLVIGDHASVIFESWLPYAVVGTGSIVPPSFLKLFQIISGSVLFLIPILSLRNLQLPLTKLALALTTSVFIASSYWELLSVTGHLPTISNELVFIGLSALFSGVATQKLGLLV
jgi:hypothetical protein